MTKSKFTIISDDTTLIETMKMIEKSYHKIAFIINNQQELVGTVTDGDIRRALLRENSLQVPIHDVMNRNPIVGDEHQTDVVYQEVLKKYKIQYLPILNKDNEIIEIVQVDKIEKNNFSNKVVLMVGGLGSRLRPLTNHFPKPMLKIGNKPILQIIIEGFKNNGFINFVLCVNYKKEIIQSYFQDGKAFGVHIEYIEENKRLGTAGALSLIKEKLDEPFFVMNGDLLTQVDFSKLLEFHSETNSIGTMCVREYEYQIPFGVIDTSEYKLISIQEKPVKKEYVNAGIYMLDPQALMHIPYDTFYDMPELFNRLIQQRLNTSVFPIHEYWMDIGQLADYEQANKDYERVSSDE